MNETPATLRLRDYMDDQDGWGHEQGHRVFEALLKSLEGLPASRVIRVSLSGVRRTDASFPRESVIELARRFRGERGFCLVDVRDPDLLDNWDAAALKRGQPLVSWWGDNWRLLGPSPSRGNTKTFEYLMATESATASHVAKILTLSLTNASTKLKQLLEGGYLLRSEETAQSGGVEYVYHRIG